MNPILVAVLAVAGLVVWVLGAVAIVTRCRGGA